MKSYFILPPIQKHYFKLQHTDYIEPPASPGATDKIKFIYPSAGAVVSMPKEDGHMIICKATHSESAATLFWHLDNNFIESTKDIHQVQIAPTEGFHRLTIIDNSGSEISIEFVVK